VWHKWWSACFAIINSLLKIPFPPKKKKKKKKLSPYIHSGWLATVPLMPPPILEYYQNKGRP
jgi:hypothetical protein